MKIEISAQVRYQGYDGQPFFNVSSLFMQAKSFPGSLSNLALAIAEALEGKVKT